MAIAPSTLRTESFNGAEDEGQEVERSFGTRRDHVAGVAWSLLHLRPGSLQVVIPEHSTQGSQVVTLAIQYSSHCVSYGPKQGAELDFEAIGVEHMLIDHRGIRRAFCPGRYKLSIQLPSILASLADRQCLFTGHSNWLTLEGHQFGYPEGSCYEVYFSLRREAALNLTVYVESAYVRDAGHPSHRPVRFKRHEKIKGWLLMLKKLRNEPIRRPVKR